MQHPLMLGSYSIYSHINWDIYPCKHNTRTIKQKHTNHKHFSC